MRFVALAVGVVVARALILTVTRPIADVLATFQSLANGDYTRNVDIARNDEMGKVLQGLQSMQIQQGFNVAEAARVGEENLRIRIGLDCVDSPVRIADNDGRIIYANRALLKAVSEMEDPLRAYIPGFQANQLVGSDLGVFYRENRQERHGALAHPDRDAAWRTGNRQSDLHGDDQSDRQRA